MKALDKKLEIRNIFCVGRNYRQHAAELGNEVPKEPFLFMKPTHALAWMEGGELRLPGGRGVIHHEIEVVVKMARDYEAGLPLSKLIDSFTLGIDFTLRAVQDELKKKGLPWLAAKGTIGSAGLAAFLPYPGERELTDGEFALKKNGEVVQQGKMAGMIHGLPNLLAFCADRYGLGAGDILYTGTPSGVGPVADGDALEMTWNGNPAGSARIVLDSRI